MHRLCPDGDICEQDWLDHFGMTQEEYAEPIRVFHESVTPFHDGQPSRNDVIRQVFLDHTNNLQDQDRATSFYAGDYYQRLLAYEFTAKTLEQLSKNGRTIGNDQDPFAEAMWTGLQDARQRFSASFTGEGLRILEHGFGNAQQVLGFMGRYPRAQYTLCDLHGRFRDFLAKMIHKYVRGVKEVSFLWVGDSGYPELVAENYYHYINSSEIMEHCPDPCATVAILGEMLKQNGVLHMSTFFNDCDGNDVSHLLRNNKYQDYDLWLAEGVHPAGLSVYGQDPRGVDKLFEKR